MIQSLTKIMRNPGWRRRAGGGFRLVGEYIRGVEDQWAEVWPAGSRWVLTVTDHSRDPPRTLITPGTKIKTARQAKAIAERTLLEELRRDIHSQPVVGWRRNERGPNGSA